jgi:hypothetical protein
VIRDPERTTPASEQRLKILSYANCSFHLTCLLVASYYNMPILYALISREKTVLAEYTATSGKSLKQFRNGSLNRSRVTGKRTLLSELY